jgi:multimeric flavodoxin WrbA
MTRAVSCVPIVLTGAGNPMRMKSLLIVYHSQSGTSAQLARAAWRGARQESEIEVSVRRAWDASTQDLSEADGLMLVMAENSGALCGTMKDFLDRTFYPAIARGLVLPYTLIISAGNDGRGARSQAERILSGYPFVAAAEPLTLRGECSDVQRSACEELGQAFATGLSMGIY